MINMETTKDRYRNPRAGAVHFRPRVTGDARAKLGALLRKEYEAGTSIRKLAAAHKLSYGTARTLLHDAGATLRPHTAR